MLSAFAFVRRILSRRITAMPMLAASKIAFCSLAALRSSPSICRRRVMSRRLHAITMPSGVEIGPKLSSTGIVLPSLSTAW